MNVVLKNSKEEEGLRKVISEWCKEVFKFRPQLRPIKRQLDSVS